MNRIRTSPEGQRWTREILKRDDYTCQKTKLRGGNMVAHHIQNFAQYPKLRFLLENGITLSEKSHIEFHKIYGFKNNTKEQIIEFLKS